MWKNTVQPGRAQMTIWRMRIACWMTKATNTHRICNTYCFSTTTTATRTCLQCYVIHILPVLLNSKLLSCFQLTSTGDPLRSHTKPVRVRVHTNTHTHTHTHRVYCSIHFLINFYFFFTDFSQSATSLYVSKPFLEFISSLVHATVPAHPMFPEVITWLCLYAGWITDWNSKYAKSVTHNTHKKPTRRVEQIRKYY